MSPGARPGQSPARSPSQPRPNRLQRCVSCRPHGYARSARATNSAGHPWPPDDDMNLQKERTGELHNHKIISVVNPKVISSFVTSSFSIVYNPNPPNPLRHSIGLTYDAPARRGLFAAQESYSRV